MGKHKKKGKGRIHHVAEANKKTDALNPFEVHINRQKHQILGRPQRNDKGLPGLAKNKAIQKRRATLLKEYLSKNKSNVFLDRRIGEKDSDITPEEKALLRFTREAKQHQKSRLFNLNDEDELTHLGQSLSDIGRYDDPRSDSDEDDEKLSASFISKAHFGGLLVEKETGESAQEPPKTRKEIIQELIAESKKQKHEKQSQREANVELTDQLDKDWKNVHSLLAIKTRGKMEDKTPQKLDNFDITVKELMFEAKGQASNRLKTPEEIAADAKNQLQKLEEDRLRRMKGASKQTIGANAKHRSADDLDDEFFRTGDTLPDSLLKSKTTPKEIKSPDMLEEQVSSENEDSDIDSDSYTDIQSNEDEINNEDECHKETVTKSAANIADNNIDEVPFVLPVPSSFEEFLKLITGRDYKSQDAIVDRIIKCNHPSLGEGNRGKLEVLFAILLQYVNDLCSEEMSDLRMLNPLTRHLCTLVHLAPEETTASLLDVIQEKQEKLQALVKKKGTGKVPYPKLDLLVFLKLVSVLYPTSDFRHPIVTPAMIIMGQILNECAVVDMRDLLSGLFITHLFLEYVSFSKRFVPEAINFLCSLLALITKSMPPGPTFQKATKLFNGIESTGTVSLSLEKPAINLHVLLTGDSENSLVIDALWIAIELISQYFQLYKELPSCKEIFSPLLTACTLLDLNSYPKNLKEAISTVVSELSVSVPRQPLCRARKKPPTLKMYEPKVMASFDGKKRHAGGKKQEQQKLLHKYKRELKGAMREVRRDNQFLARQWLDERMDRDADRKRKVKELYQELSLQEGNFKKLKRKNK